MLLVPKISRSVVKSRSTPKVLLVPKGKSRRISSHLLGPRYAIGISTTIRISGSRPGDVISTFGFFRYATKEGTEHLALALQ